MNHISSWDSPKEIPQIFQWAYGFGRRELHHTQISPTNLHCDPQRTKLPITALLHYFDFWTIAALIWWKQELNNYYLQLINCVKGVTSTKASSPLGNKRYHILSLGRTMYLYSTQRIWTYKDVPFLKLHPSIIIIIVIIFTEIITRAISNLISNHILSFKSTEFLLLLWSLIFIRSFNGKHQALQLP